MPVAIAALIWVGASRWSSCHARRRHRPALVVLGLILAGGVYFAYMMIFNREVLDTEPGVDMFAVEHEATE